MNMLLIVNVILLRTGMKSELCLVTCASREKYADPWVLTIVKRVRLCFETCVLNTCVPTCVETCVSTVYTEGIIIIKSKKNSAMGLQ